MHSQKGNVILFDHDELFAACRGADGPGQSRPLYELARRSRAGSGRAGPAGPGRAGLTFLASPGGPGPGRACKNRRPVGPGFGLSPPVRLMDLHEISKTKIHQNLREKKNHLI